MSTVKLAQIKPVFQAEEHEEKPAVLEEEVRQTIH